MDERIEDRFDEIDKYFNRLETVTREAEGISRTESKENLVRKIVSAAIDIASRIIAIESEGRPESYKDYFRKLEDLDVIDKELSEKLVEMAKFRNLIVHQYHEIREDRIDEIIEDNLKDVRDFEKSVIRYYEK